MFTGDFSFVTKERIDGPNTVDGPAVCDNTSNNLLMDPVDEVRDTTRLKSQSREVPQ